MGNILDIMEETMAMKNLDIALDMLNEAIKTKPKGDYREQVKRLDFLTETIHNHVWHNQVSRQDIKTRIIPLFNQTIPKIHGDEEYIVHTKETIGLRLKNIRGYLKGEESYAFVDFAAELAKSLAI